MSQVGPPVTFPPTKEEGMISKEKWEIVGHHGKSSPVHGKSCSSTQALKHWISRHPKFLDRPAFAFFFAKKSQGEFAQQTQESQHACMMCI